MNKNYKMRKLSDILKFINSSKDLRLITYSLSLIVTWSLFEKYFVGFIIDVLLPIFEKLNFSLLFEIITFIFFVSILFIRLLQILTKFCESKFISYSIISFGGIYIYYRFYDHIFNFYYFTFFKKVAYLDILIVFFISSIILLIINYYLTFKTQNVKIIEDEKLHDNPWEAGKQDLLNRYEGAKELAFKIIAQKTKKSFAYGIVGGWGDGKTSFLNMIENELLKNNQTIVVKFNPWKSSSSKNIQNDFLVKLREYLTTYSSEAPSKFNKYIYALFGANKNIFFRVISIISNEQNEITKQFSNLNSAISKIERKIVVIIDDLDRLDRKEVFEVLKLIRNIGNFDNTIFIAAYDRNYINDAIKKFSKYRYEVFIEKIFQQEIILPDYPFSILSNELKESLKKNFINEQKIIPEIESQLGLDNEEVLFPPGIIPYDSKLDKIFTNIRDVKRFANSFTHSYYPIMDEINISDMFHVEILKMKYYKIFLGLKQKEFLKTNQNSMNYFEFEESKFKEFCSLKSIKENEIPLNILKQLFPEKIYDKRHDVIAYKASFPIYFSNRLFNRLTRKEFYQVIYGKPSNLKNSLDVWISKNYYSDVYEYLVSTEYNLFESKDDFKNFIELHFLLIEKDLDINIEFLLNHFKGQNKTSIVEKYYKSENEYENYIKNKISNADFPFKIRKLIYELIREYQYNKDFAFLLTLEELQQLSIKYLQQYLEKISDLTEHGMWLYYTCIEKIDEKSKIHLLSDANKLMKDFITKKNSKFYLDNFIRPYFSPDDGHARTVEPFVSSIFGSYDEFEKFINNCENYESIDTIKYFFNIFKNHGYEAVNIKNPEKELKIKNKKSA
jgi:hypothetical protein